MFNLEQSGKFFPKGGNKCGAPIRNNRVQEAMITKNAIKKQPGQTTSVDPQIYYCILSGIIWPLRDVIHDNVR